MTEYFIHDSKGQSGPYTLDQLKSINLTSETPVWHSGLSEWKKVKDIQELSALLAPKSIPPVYPDETNSSSSPEYSTAMEEYFPTEKKKSLKIPIIVTGIVIATALIIWLVNKNNQHSETIKELETQITATKKEDEHRQAAEQLKIQEETRAAEVLYKKNFNYRNNWQTYIKEQHGRPDVDYSWGGISEFPVAVSNETEYPIDQVDVVVVYIRKSGEIWQRKIISFFNLAPNSQETKIAPSSVNGVEVKAEISKVVCAKMQFCYPINNGNPSDPYFCK